MSRNFMELLRAKWAEGKFVCVGLDSAEAKLPSFQSVGVNHQLLFNQGIVDATKDLVCAYKPNLAFYKRDVGKRVLADSIAYIHEVAPDALVSFDPKQGDIGNTNEGYVEDDFDFYGADAVTISPYLGKIASKPFLDQVDKGIIVVCRTSNDGADEFQDAPIDPLWIKHRRDGAYEFFNLESDGRCIPLYQYVAYRVAHVWNANGNCAVVVGATYPGEMEIVRGIVGDSFPILIPGIGAQGGEVQATVQAGQDSHGEGMIINSSRGIIFASNGMDFAEVARQKTQELHDQITQYRKAAA